MLSWMTAGRLVDKFQVPAAEQAELKTIVQSTYGDIVIGKSYLTGLTVTHIQESNPRHEQHRNSGQPLALSRQEHARGGVGQSVCRILRNLWRPHLRLQEFGESQGIPLPNSPGAAKTSALPPALPLSRQSSAAHQPARG